MIAAGSRWELCGWITLQHASSAVASSSLARPHPRRDWTSVADLRHLPPTRPKSRAPLWIFSPPCPFATISPVLIQHTAYTVGQHHGETIKDRPGQAKSAARGRCAQGQLISSPHRPELMGRTRSRPRRRRRARRASPSASRTSRRRSSYGTRSSSRCPRLLSGRAGTRTRRMRTISTMRIWAWRRGWIWRLLGGLRGVSTRRD